MPQSQLSPSVPVVYVVDDDVSIRESLQPLLSFEGWNAVMCASAAEFLELQRMPAPSCLILDVSLPDLSGLDLQEQFAIGQTAPPIIFITGYGDVPMTVKAMKAGAAEFLMKPFSDEVLVDAVRQALARSAAALEDDETLRLLKVALGSLSRREREVMDLVVVGLLNKQVGFKLGISEITVKAHRGQMMRKMKARSLAELIGMNTRLHPPRTHDWTAKTMLSADALVSGTPSYNGSAAKSVT